jgi:hypothetical protein
MDGREWCLTYEALVELEVMGFTAGAGSCNKVHSHPLKLSHTRFWEGKEGEEEREAPQENRLRVPLSLSSQH